MSGFHHVELWVADLERVRESWGWLLAELGFEPDSAWVAGQSWSAGGAYLTLTESPHLVRAPHDRRRPGLNHIAFRGGPRGNVDRLMAAALDHGWRALYADRYPHAGGEDHYAAWLENVDGFKVEIVAERL